jgi:hypothetical protein
MLEIELCNFMVAWASPMNVTQCYTSVEPSGHSTNMVTRNIIESA